MATYAAVSFPFLIVYEQRLENIEKHVAGDYRLTRIADEIVVVEYLATTF